MGDRIGLFAGIEECRFKRLVQPGDRLTLEVTMEKLGRRFGKGRAVASVDGEVACEALLSFVIPPEGALRVSELRLAVLADIHGNVDRAGRGAPRYPFAEAGPHRDLR